MSSSSAEMTGLESGEERGPFMTLLDGCAAGDDVCWRQLVDIVQQRCWKYVYVSLGGNANETEEVFQGVLISLYKKIQTNVGCFQTEKHFFHYMWVIVRGRVRGGRAKLAWEHKRRYSIDDLQWLFVLGVDPGIRWRMLFGKNRVGGHLRQGHIPSSCRSPYEQAALHDLIRYFNHALSKALGQLTVRQKAIFELVNVNGGTITDATQDPRTFGEDGNAVHMSRTSQIYHKTIKKLREILLRDRGVARYCEEYYSGGYNREVSQSEDDLSEVTADDLL